MRLRPIAFAKAHPGELYYSSGNIWTPTHLVPELFNSATGTRLVPIHYKGSGPSVIGVLTGETQVIMSSVTAVMPHVRSKRLVALAVTSPKRTPVAPQVPTLVELAGGPKGDDLKEKIQNGYPGFVKTTLDGVNQTAYLTGQSKKSARDVFYYFSGATPSAVRYKNWKMYYNMSAPGADGWILPLVPFHFTLVQNIKRDPFEQAVGTDQKSAMSLGGALGGPMTAFQYDWNMLPIGQQLWLQHLSSYEKFPPLQAPASYNLSQVMEQVKANRHAGD